MRAIPAFILGALALLLAGLPYVAGYITAPRGATFLGALNNLGDVGQYLAAIRQGMEGHLLYTNQYTSLRVSPVLMYPLYTAAGFLLQPIRLAPVAAYHLLHVLAVLALLAALWRCCSAFLPARRVAAFALALFGGGLYLPVLLVSGLIHLPFAPVALTAPELSAFAALLLSPHGALGLAAEVWALTGYLLWRRDGHLRHLGGLALGGLALGLCYPFGLPVLLAVVGVDAASYWLPLGSPAGSRLRAVPAGLFPVALALLPALGVALYYEVLFHHDPLWGASNMLRLPPPGLALLLAAFGPLLALGLGPALWSRALRRSLLSSPAGRLALIWAAVNGLLLLAPLPQSERLLNGWTVPLALLAAVALGSARRPRTTRRVVVALSLSNVMMALLYLSLTLTGRNAAYYAPAPETAAVTWLAAHTGPADVVMASAGSGNLIVSAARCRVVSGQNFETFNWAAAQRDVLAFYAPHTPAAARRSIVYRYGVTFVLVGPYERALGDFVPAKGYRLAYAYGPVRIFAVEGV